MAGRHRGRQERFGHELSDPCNRGRYVLFAELLTQFYRSCADHSEAKLLSKYLSYDCLLIDEIGYVEVEAVQVGLFFTLIAAGRAVRKQDSKVHLGRQISKG